MKATLSDIIEYIISIINEFADAFKLTEHQAFLYLKNHGAIEFIEKHYNILHTLDFKESVENLASYCRKNGGVL